MKKLTRKNMVMVLSIFLMFAMAFTVNVQAKTKKSTMTLLQKDTLSYDTGAGSPTNLKIKNKSICTAKRYDIDSKVFITGKKKGKTYVTFKDGSQTYQIKVIVLSLKETKAKAKKRMDKKIASLKKGTRYLYKDLDKDGIKELILKDKIWYYNYRAGKLMIRKNPYKDFYVGKSNIFYGVFKHPKYTAYVSDSNGTVTENNAEFAELGEYVGFDDHYIYKFASEGKGYRQYTAIGKTIYGQKYNYSYYDHGYDQDDYQYVSFTKDKMIQRIQSRLKSGKRLIWKTK